MSDPILKTGYKSIFIRKEEQIYMIIQPRGNGERLAKWMITKGMADEVKVYNGPITALVGALFDGFIWVTTWLVTKLLHQVERVAIAVSTHRIQVRVVRR